MRMTPLISRLSACVDAEGGDFEHHLGGDYKLLMRIYIVILML